MQLRHQALLLTILLLLFPIPFAWAEDFKDFAEFDLEELLNTQIITAFRTNKKLPKSRNAVYVLTKEDIIRSGALDIPDLFSLVPDLQSETHNV